MNKFRFSLQLHALERGSSDLFSIAIAQIDFPFHCQMDDQIDGVAMDSPFAPVLANLVLGQRENLIAYCLYRHEEKLKSYLILNP